LDAQYFGVPQRRRRVFVLGVRGGGVDPAEVLSLAESLSGHLAASGEAREGVAADAGAGAAITFDARGNGDGDVVNTMAGDHQNRVTDYTALVVRDIIGVPRRLTPVECERLMGWPDQHTAHGITEAGKPYALAGTARYKLCGNGIASPVTAWIGFQLRRLLTRDK
jgi:DNA (cytosine-5)-methyltransferase 1